MNIGDLQAFFATLHFLRPHWLWGLLALPLLAWAWRVRRQRQSAWRGAVDAHLLPHLLEPARRARGVMAPWLAALALLLALLALAGPSWRMGEQPLLQGEAPLVIALDLSTAMLANDLPPSRLLQARAKLASLLRQRAGGQVGLVAFADDAYTVAPLTEDAGNVALFLDALTPDVMPVDGSNAARAIAQSETLLKQAGYREGDILVLSDHADAAARDAAAQARSHGYRVSALGLGSASGAAYRNGQGGIAHTRLDAGSLQALAASGGGRYAGLTADSADLDALGVLDTTASQSAIAAHGGKVGVWRDDGYWLLLPLMLLALFAFRRGGMFAAVLLCACLPWQPVRAADTGTLWQRADQVEHARMQAGEEAYRKQDFAAAERAWQSLPGAEAAYNRGNALAKMGRYEDAVAAYDRALQLQPAMQDAAANRSAVEAALKRKPPPSKQDNGRGQQQQTPQTGKPQDGKPQDGKPDQQGKPDSASQSSADDKSKAAQPPQDGRSNAQPSDKPPGQPPASPPQAADGNAQHDADAEQRARMQQALQRNPQGKQETPAGQKVEGDVDRAQQGAADREKQLANEAWLQRVPDDPGGLLRAKFRLEYERRQETGER